MAVIHQEVLGPDTRDGAGKVQTAGIYLIQRPSLRGLEARKGQNIHFVRRATNCNLKSRNEEKINKYIDTNSGGSKDKSKVNWMQVK